MLFHRFYFPIFTLLLSGTSVSLFYLLDDPVKHSWSLHVPSNTSATEWWNFFSCQVLHIDEAHLFNNVFILCSVGLIAEIIHGPIPSFVIFWIAGTTGILFESAWWQSEPVRLLGASAGVYGLCASYLAHLTMNWAETPLRKVWTLALCACILFTILVYVMTDEEDYRVAHYAHVTGFVQGFLVGCIFVVNLRVYRFEHVISASCFLLATSLIVSAWYRIVIVYTTTS